MQVQRRAVVGLVHRERFCVVVDRHVGRDAEREFVPVERRLRLQRSTSIGLLLSGFQRREHDLRACSSSCASPLSLTMTGQSSPSRYRPWWSSGGGAEGPHHGVTRRKS